MNNPNNIRIPEALQGIDLNLNGYEVPGGKGWYDYFNGIRTNVFGEIIAKYEGHRRSFVEGIAKANAISKDLIHSRKFLTDLNAQLGSTVATFTQVQQTIGTPAPFVTLPKPETFVWLKQAAEATDDLLAWLKSANAWKKELEIIDTDIAFLRAIETFFAKDQDLDLMLWAVHTVDCKYRAKIVREATRTCKEVVAARTVIENTKSLIKTDLMERVGEGYKSLCRAYDVLPGVIKHLKREIEQKGAASLSSIDWRNESMSASKSAEKMDELIPVLEKLLK